MRSPLAAAVAAGLGLATPALAIAQQPAPPAPAFAAPNVTEKGARDMAAACASCHGTGGHSAPGSPIAPLAGRTRDDIVQAMAQFKAGGRPATLMHQVSKGYTEAEIAAMAAYFAAQRR